MHTAIKQVSRTPLIPGHWRPVQRTQAPDDPDWIIKFCCPNCGTEADLTGHDIDDGGQVSPSVVCPVECGFHDQVTLADFDEPEVPPHD